MSIKNFRKKKDFITLILSGSVFLVLGIFFSIQAFSSYTKLKGPLLDMNTASPDDLKDGQYVEINVEYANYSFCENVETTNYIFKRTTEQYYLINALKDNDYYIGLRVAESKKDDLEKLSDYTWYNSDTNPGPLHYTGKLCKADSEISGYMRDYIYDMFETSYDISLTDENKALLDSYMKPYYIEIKTTADCRTDLIFSLIFVGIGLLIILINLVRHKNTVNAPDVQPIPATDTYGTAYSDPNASDMSTGMNYTDPFMQNQQAASDPLTQASDTGAPDTNTAEGLDAATFGNNTSSFKLKD